MTNLRFLTPVARVSAPSSSLALMGLVAALYTMPGQAQVNRAEMQVPDRQSAAYMQQNQGQYQNQGKYQNPGQSYGSYEQPGSNYYSGDNRITNGSLPVGSVSNGPNDLSNSYNLQGANQTLNLKDEAITNQSRRFGRDGMLGQEGDGRGDNQKAEKQPSQFQKFVFQATGKMLPIYGQTFFEKPQAYQVDASAPVPAGHLIGPGDEINVEIWGGVNYSGKIKVDRTGQVSIPSIGAVKVAGVPAGQIGAILRSQIAQTYSNFELSANMGEVRGIPVYVVGQANQPGSYTLPGTSTLVNALFASGGPNAQGTMRNIQLKRKGQVVATIDLYDFIGAGDKSQDVMLQAGDVIVIPPAGPRAAVVGAFDHEAIYELQTDGKKEKTTIADILSINGGAPVLAKSQKALIERIATENGTSRKVEEVALDSSGNAKTLKDGDILTLLDISPQFDNAVTLQGNVADPLRYKWFPGMRIRDLIPEAQALITNDYYLRKNLLVQNVYVDSEAAGNSIDRRVRNMVDEINWDYAVIERLDPKQLRTQIIPFNLGLAVLQGDESQNIELQPGDVVTVLSQKDLTIPVERQTRLVRVQGEVMAPGLYQVQPGETLSQLLMRIGGVTPQAYLYGTSVQRESVKKRQQENLDMVIRRLESQQQSQMLYLMANRTSDSGQAALVEQQQKLAQQQLASLRAMRSNGRVSLELDPKKATLANLPELPLEDGDEIIIPSMPGFISVAGAVNNENVFIYKPGRSVADVIKVAGLREEADAKQVFVLRADGSIVADSSLGMFSSVNRLELMPGDTVIVPEKLDRESTRNFVARQLKDFTQILSQFGVGIAAIKVFKDL